MIQRMWPPRWRTAGNIRDGSSECWLIPWILCNGSYSPVLCCKMETKACDKKMEVTRREFKVVKRSAASRSVLSAGIEGQCVIHEGYSKNLSGLLIEPPPPPQVHHMSQVTAPPHTSWQTGTGKEHNQQTPSLRPDHMQTSTQSRTSHWDQKQI